LTEHVAIAMPATSPAGASAATVERFSDDRRRALQRLQAIAQLAWVLPLLLFAAIATMLYRQAFAGAAQSVDRAARVAQEQALKLFETNAMLLQRMLDLLGEASDDEVLLRNADVHERLRRMVANLPQVQGVFVNSAKARALANSIVTPPPRDLDYSDREWYSAHRNGDVGVFFTGQLRSRVSGEPFFDMSRRRVSREGAFLGTVHVSLRPTYLTDFYAELARDEPGLRFGVFRSDGVFIARYPGDVPEGARLASEDAILQAIRGTDDVVQHRSVSSLDGTDRLRSLRQLGTYPLWAGASMNVSDVRALWLRQIGWLALFVVPATLTLTWLARVALARTRREVDAAQRLDDETLRRQRMEVALVQSQKLEALGRLTGGVAHDFNNLLMVVSNNLYVMRHMFGGLDGNPQLAAIERSVATGTKLTRQLLSFTRRQALVPERIDLHARLPALLELLPPLLGRTIRVTVQIDADVPPIEVDPAELELALINLAANAKDAMSANGHIRISARSATAPVGERGPHDKFVVLEVEDDGTGMPPDVAARAFEPFYTTKAVGKGTGLGLSQVQALCQRAGGMATIESTLGGGTRVLLYFPAALNEPVPVEASEARRMPGNIDCKVLLVEDNDAVAHGCRQALESMGCRVERAASSAAALAALADRGSERVDIVVSDIEMPGSIDGIALADRLATAYPGLPVLLMTGYAERLQQAVARRIDVLPKPVAPQVLGDAIRRSLAARAARTA
jgi:signal transduction histidine kinase/ActR/RegA family two-component response regulator